MLIYNRDERENIYFWTVVVVGSNVIVGFVGWQ